MKIILNREELIAFKGFMCEYAQIVADTSMAIEPELHEELKGKSSEDLVRDMFDEIILAGKVDDEGISLNPSCPVSVYQLDKDEYILELSDELFVKYNKAMVKSMVVLKPFSNKLIEIVVKHKQSIYEAKSRIRGVFGNSIIFTHLKDIALSSVKCVASLVGLGGFAEDIINLAFELANSKEVKASMVEIEREFNSVINK